jgi:hypothetical protein
MDSKNDSAFINTIVNIFKQENATVCYVELEASVEERLERNKSPNGLKYKPSKRNFEASKNELLEIDNKFILN